MKYLPKPGFARIASRSATERGFEERVALKTRDVFAVMEGVKWLNECWLIIAMPGRAVYGAHGNQKLLLAVLQTPQQGLSLTPGFFDFVYQTVHVNRLRIRLKMSRQDVFGC